MTQHLEAISTEEKLRRTATCREFRQVRKAQDRGGHAMDKQLQALQHNFEAAVQRAMESCEAYGHAASDQFRGVTKLIEMGNTRRAQGAYKRTDTAVFS